LPTKFSLVPVDFDSDPDFDFDFSNNQLGAFAGVDFGFRQGARKEHGQGSVTAEQHLRKTRLIGPECHERFLPYRSPLLQVLRDGGVGFSGLSTLRRNYCICRRHSPLHLLLFTIQGTGWLMTGGFEGTLAPGSVWVSPAGTWQRYGIQRGPWRIVWFSLARDWRWSAIERLGTAVRESALGPRLGEAVSALLDESGPGPDADREVVDLYGRLILRLLHREASRPDTGAIADRLRRMVNIVRRHVDYPWTVPALLKATSLNITPGHFARLCGEHLGETPLQLVTRLRMEQAAEILLNTDSTLETIAERTGYASPFSLSAAFKRHFGQSPRTYRKAHAR